jgi:GNAT superfamily N-acetyltransferase
VTPHSFFTTETDEPSVIGWMPAAAAYFRDPDGHLLEYLAMLDDDPRPHLGIVSWSLCTARLPGGPPRRMRIRTACSDDLAALVEIERATGTMFLQLDADVFVGHDPGSVEELIPYADDDRAFVLVDAYDRPVGYLLVDPLDGAAHIEQVSVHPDHARKGLGRALIEHAASWASARDLDRSRSPPTSTYRGTARTTSGSASAI